jgi:hypothetical protein
VLEDCICKQVAANMNLQYWQKKVGAYQIFAAFLQLLLSERREHQGTKHLILHLYFKFFYLQQPEKNEIEA